VPRSAQASIGAPRRASATRGRWRRVGGPTNRVEVRCDPTRRRRHGRWPWEEGLLSLQLTRLPLLERDARRPIPGPECDLGGRPNRTTSVCRQTICRWLRRDPGASRLESGAWSWIRSVREEPILAGDESNSTGRNEAIGLDQTWEVAEGEAVRHILAREPSRRSAKGHRTGSELADIVCEMGPGKRQARSKRQAWADEDDRAYSRHGESTVMRQPLRRPRAKKVQVRLECGSLDKTRAFLAEATSWAFGLLNVTRAPGHSRGASDEGRWTDRRGTADGVGPSPGRGHGRDGLLGGRSLNRNLRGRGSQ
jgi:hypothetical protein